MKITVYLSNNEHYEFEGKELSTGGCDFFSVTRKYYFDKDVTIGKLWWKKVVKTRDYGYVTLMSFKYSLVERVEYSENV